MLPKAHLTSHFRMSGFRWVITPSWLSGSWGSFLYSASVYSCHLFLISSVSVRSLPFLSFIVPIFAWKFPLISLIFLKSSSLSHSIVFLYFCALITLHWTVETVTDFIILGSKITADGDCSHETKILTWVFAVCINIYHIFFIHLFIDGHFLCIHILAIVSSAAMNTGVHISFLICIFIYLGQIFRV